MFARAQRPDYFASRPQPEVSSSASALELAHPDLVRALKLLWGHAEMNLYFDRIWAGEAGLDFSPDCLSELMLLAQLHRRLVPRPSPQIVLPSQKRDDPWGSGFHR